jgi:hypothetical protein
MDIARGAGIGRGVVTVVIGVDDVVVPIQDGRSAEIGEVAIGLLRGAVVIVIADLALYGRYPVGGSNWRILALSRSWSGVSGSLHHGW